MNRRQRKQLDATSELQAEYAKQQAEYEAQLVEGRQAMERSAVQQAEYDAQLRESRQAMERHDALLAASEESHARQLTQLEAMDALIARWSTLADKVEGLVDGRNT